MIYPAAQALAVEATYYPAIATLVTAVAAPQIVENGRTT